jgi:hypothetical protein
MVDWIEKTRPDHLLLTRNAPHWQRLQTKIRRNKEGHFILIKGTIHQEGVTILNIYMANLSAPNYI